MRSSPLICSVACTLCDWQQSIVSKVNLRTWLRDAHPPLQAAAPPADVHGPSDCPSTGARNECGSANPLVSNEIQYVLLEIAGKPDATTMYTLSPSFRTFQEKCHEAEQTQSSVSSCVNAALHRLRLHAGG
jgi:hypothetical protein